MQPTNKTRFHHKDKADSTSIVLGRGFYDGEPRRLTAEEIAELYPAAPVNLAPLTSQEKWERVARNMKARRVWIAAAPPSGWHVK